MTVMDYTGALVGIRAASVTAKPEFIAKFIPCISMLLIGLLLAANPVNGQVLTASVAQLPGHSELGVDNIPRGSFIELIAVMNEVYAGGDIQAGIYPFKRSIGNVISGRADFHLPLIKNPNGSDSELPYRYVTEPITRVAFVVYSLEARPPIEDLTRFRNLSVATLRGHSHLFPFEIKELSGIEVALKMLAAGRDMDAVIIEQEAADRFIRQHKIKSLRRQLYRHFDSSLVIAKSEASEELDVLLSDLLRRVKAQPESKKLIDKIHRPYDNWQPKQMGW